MTEKTSVGAAMSDPDLWPVEPFEVPPHPWNLQFLEALSAHVMKTLGERLHLVADGGDYQWAACFIRDYFAPAFDDVPSLPRTPDLIRHYSGPLSQVEPAFDMDVFGSLMGSIPAPLVEVQCAVTRNLDWLRTKLHLSALEVKLLLWTYAISHRRSDRVRDACGVIRVASHSAAHRAMAILLEEPLEAVERCFAAPNRMLAMRLMWKGRRTVPFGLDECFEASDLLPAVLETVHRSTDAMLDRLLELEPSWTLDPKIETPSALFFQWFEKPVADAFATTVRGRPLSAEHIVALLEWLTGYQFEPAQCSLLAGHLTLEAIEQALKWCFVSNARCEREVTPLMTLSALYAVAA